MASELRVDKIIPSSGTSIGIGTAGGTINFLGNSQINTTGVITATSFSGSGANLTGISQVGGSTGADFDDNVKLRFGTGNDLQVYHDSSASYLLNTGSNLNVGTTSGNNTQIYGNNSARWLFTYDGHFLPAVNNSYDIGSTSLRIRNIFTNDLNLSNEGSKNSVDGTWGDYTIQEGESDLFLINNRNGKKYKFNLTEVD